MGMFVRTIVLLIAVVIGIGFGSVNFESTTVDVLFTTLNAPLVVFLAVAFAIGIVIGLLASGIRILGLREQLRRARRRDATPPTADRSRPPPAPKLR